HRRLVAQKFDGSTRPGGSEGRNFGQVASDVHLVACNSLILLPYVDDDTSCDALPSLEGVAGPCRRCGTAVAERVTRPARVAIGCACPVRRCRRDSHAPRVRGSRRGGPLPSNGPAKPVPRAPAGSSAC